MQGFCDLHEEFTNLGVQVLGASIDTWASADAFKESLGAEFPLLGDWPRQDNGKLYEVYDPERFTDRRITFVLDKEHVIRHIIDDPRDFERHPKDALEAVKKLG